MRTLRKGDPDSEKSSSMLCVESRRFIPNLGPRLKSAGYCSGLPPPTFLNYCAKRRGRSLSLLGGEVLAIESAHHS